MQVVNTGEPSVTSSRSTGRRHLFRLDHPALHVSGLGNHVVWAAALRYVADRDKLDAFVIPPQSHVEDIRAIWHLLFPERVVTAVPPEIDTISEPGEKAKAHGLSAPTIFECALWESGFSLRDGETLALPVLWKHDPAARRAMIFPVEYTDENRYYDTAYWVEMAAELRKHGYEVNLFGATQNQRDRGNGVALVGQLVTAGAIDHVYSSSLTDLGRCIAASSLAIGASTGPSWCCLLSDIPQIALDRPRDAHHLWSFEQNLRVLAKPLRVVKGKARLPFEADASATKMSLRFVHGLGDCTNFARILSLYTKRGFDIEVQCNDDKAFLFRSVGARIAPAATIDHTWPHPFTGTVWNFGACTGADWAGNKIGCNLDRPPLPRLGDRDDTWRELVTSAADLTSKVEPQRARPVRAACDGLPRPVVLLHTIGNTSADSKSLPPEFHFPFYEALLDRTEGTIVVLDWDNRAPLFPSYRLRAHRDVFGYLHVDELVAAMAHADLVVGIDSGPLHLAATTPTPRVGLFRKRHYPSTFALPDPRMLAISVGALRDWNVHKRIQWNIVEDGRDDLTPDGVADLCARMLLPARYLNDTAKPADVQLQQFVSWCRGRIPAGVSPYADRHVSFDILLREAKRRFKAPVFVETGCIRSSEDWGGAGYSTYLFGAFVSRCGGKLHSVDISPGNCIFARARTAVFGDAVEIHTSRGADWLKSYEGRIDVLYLDSTDTHIVGHQEECDNECAAALPKLHQGSLVVFDDSPYRGERFLGKAGIAVPRLLAAGWRVLHAGYQVILCKG